MALLKQSTAFVRTFLMVQSADHVAALTGATVTVTVSKAGAAFGAAGGAVAEIGSGWYKITLTTTDTNTVGDLAFHCTATSGDPSDFVDQVVTVITSDLATSSALATVQADTDDIQTRLPAALVSGRIDASVGAMAANVLTAAAIATDAITAAKIAADAIGASELATDAVTEIQAAVAAGSVASVVGAVGSVTGAVGSVTAGVTVTTNNDKTGYTASTVSDKTGYSLSAGGIQAIWDALTSALTTVGSVGKLLVDNVNAAISSRLASSAYVDHTAAIAAVQADTDDVQTRLPAALVGGRIVALTQAMATDVLDAAALKADAVTEIQSGLATTTALTTAQADLTTLIARLTSTRAGLLDNLSNLDATVSSRLASGSYTAPANATIASIYAAVDTEVASILADVTTILAAVDTEVAAIKTKTDLIPASPAAVGSAMTLDLTQVLNTGSTGDTVGGALVAARAQGFGKWVLTGTSLVLYAADGTTVVRTFTLDSASSPTSRT